MGTSTDSAPETAAVPPGSVTLTDRRTRSSRQVEVAAFRMAVHPVTQEAYAAVTGERPAAAQGPALPVESVWWWDAVRSCNALSAGTGRVPAYYGTYRVLRGGGWFDEHRSCRASVRRRSHPRCGSTMWGSGSSSTASVQPDQLAVPLRQARATKR
jgi:formylglycine-generating enzyme required for sulfatase activity